MNAQDAKPGDRVIFTRKHFALLTDCVAVVPLPGRVARRWIWAGQRATVVGPHSGLSLRLAIGAGDAIDYSSVEGDFLRLLTALECLAEIKL